MSDYDLDLKSSGDGWLGTYVNLILAAAVDLLSDNEAWPVEITTDNKDVITGLLAAVDTQDYTLTIEDRPRRVSINDIVRFRA